MTDLVMGGVGGLLLGMAVQRCGLTERERVTGALALRRRNTVKALLYALGVGMMLVAFLSWLAVIDVDWLVVIPLNGGVILGGVIFGAAAGLTGMTPGTALAMTGGGRALEGLCGIAGCVAGAALWHFAAPVVGPLRGWIPETAQTLFKVTLTEPYVLAGGFLGLGCLGAVVWVLGGIVRPEAVRIPEVPPETVPEAPEEKPEEEPVSTDAADVREDTFVAILPGEEPVVVDTADGDGEAKQTSEKPEDEETEHVQTEAEDGEAREDEPPQTQESAEIGETEQEETMKANGEEHRDHAPDLEALAEEAPVMEDHPELEEKPETDEDWAGAMARMEAASGQGTPTQEEAMPVGARAVGEPVRKDMLAEATEKEDEDAEPMG